MMLLVGRQRNTIQIKNNLQLGLSKIARQKFREVVLLHNLGLYGMRNLAIIMMLPQGFIMMEILVSLFDISIFWYSNYSFWKVLLSETSMDSY